MKISGPLDFFGSSKISGAFELHRNITNAKGIAHACFIPTCVLNKTLKFYLTSRSMPCHGMIDKEGTGMSRKVLVFRIAP